MKIKLLLFAYLIQDVGSNSIEMNISGEECEMKHLHEKLTEKYPALKNKINHIQCAVNQIMVDSNAIIRDGDEVALMPPFSGG